MGIYDQWGNSVSSERWAHGASRNRSRGPVLRAPNRGVNELIPANDRKTLSALSRRLVFNDGPGKEAIRQKASYSVGCAWSPIYSGSDSAAGEEAVSWLETVWFPVCDYRGHGHDWHGFLETVSKCMDRDGEAFILLTESEEGFPQVLIIPSFQVWSDPSLDEVETGPYRGLDIEDGVISRKGRAVAYRVNKSVDGKDHEDISARDLIHLYDSDFPEQRRGYPAFSHALQDMKNGLNSKELETVRQNLISSMYLVEKGPHGMDPTDPRYTADIDTSNKTEVLSEEIEPGIRQLSSDEELEIVTHDAPGDIWESFQDRLIRSAIVGIGWSYALVWKSPGQGTAERAEVMRARKAVQSRQKRLTYLAKRCITYAIAKGDASPRLTVTAPANMLKWSFSMPERLTVDDGREARSMREAVEAGLCSESEYLAFKGKNMEQHAREQASDQVTKARVAREVSESNAEGVEINPESLGLQSAQPSPIMEPTA